jgi:hypothetical protein
MKKWMRKFEKAMAAVAFAEAGEFETARETIKEQRKILLALRGEKGDTHSLKYAINMCKRIGAELQILHVSEIEKGLMNQLKSQLKKEGIVYDLIQKKGSLEEEIRNHTGIKGDILFVVVEVSEGINIRSKKTETIIKDAWKNLKCPLVVVSQGNAAFAA